MKIKTKEKIIFKVHPHRLYVVIPEFSLTILGIVFFTFAYSLIPKWGLVIFTIALTFTILMIFLDWICINYYLTSQKLIEERGIIGKRIVFIPLNKVQDITCRFGIIGRIFGFGDLEIESAGTYGKIVFSFIANPKGRKEQITEALLKIKQNEINMEKKEGK